MLDNVFGTTAGQVPGAPVQPFAGSGTYAGIGAFANLQNLLGKPILILFV